MLLLAAAGDGLTVACLLCVSTMREMFLEQAKAGCMACEVFAGYLATALDAQVEYMRTGNSFAVTVKAEAKPLASTHSPTCCYAVTA